MRIWIVMTGEALPIDGKQPRLRRAAMLAKACASRGHQVTWWTSTFHHQKKQQRANVDTSVLTDDGVRIEMLYAPAYRNNISIGRLINHRMLGKSLASRLTLERQPDVIFCAWPTIEFGVASVKYGAQHGVPVVIDVRDLWPDIFVDVAPRMLRPLMRVAVSPMKSSAQYVFRNCSAIVAISPGYLKWALEYAGRSPTDLDRVFPLGYEKPRVERDELEHAQRELLALGLDPSKKIVWFVGVFGATYDLATVIEAARRLKQRGRPDVQFVLSGDGEMGAKWRALAAGLSNVIFTGWVDGSKIACLGALSAVGLAAYAPSAPQGLPNKLYEYMAFGIPVLSSLHGEAELFLRQHKCGVTYRAGDSEHLASELISLIDGACISSVLGRNGRQVYDAHLSSDIVSDSMLNYLLGIRSTANPSSAIEGAPAHGSTSSLRRTLLH